MVFEAPDGPLCSSWLLLVQICSQHGVLNRVTKVRLKRFKNLEGLFLTNLKTGVSQGASFKRQGKKSVRPKVRWALFLKFEDVPKMVSKLFKIAQKRSQNDPKMVQDWLKLRKIAPETAQDSPNWIHKGSQNDPKFVRECLKLPKIYNIYLYNTYYMLKGLKRPYKAL